MSKVVRLQINQRTTPTRVVGASAHERLFAEHNAKSSIMFDVYEKPVLYDDRRGFNHSVQSHKVIIRNNESVLASTDAPLAVVGTDYTVIHNRELFTSIEQGMLDTLDARHFDNLRITDRMSYGGRDSYREYCFAANECAVDDKSRTSFRVVVQNSYGGTSLKILSGFIDFYCMNGMVVGDYSHIVRRHTKGLTLDDLVKHIDNQVRTYAQWNERFKQWAQRTVSVRELTTLLDAMVASKAMSARQRTAIETQLILHEKPVHGSTLWAIVSAMTWWATHSPVRETKNDHAATTVINRQLEVRDWMNCNEFKKLAA